MHGKVCGLYPVDVMNSSFDLLVHDRLLMLTLL